MEANFYRKSSLLLVETIFWLLKNRFFIYHIFQVVKSVSPERNDFLTNFLTNRKGIVLFRALLKILKFGGNNTSKTNLVFCSGRLIFWLVEVNFFHFSGTPASERYFLSSGNVYLYEFFSPYGGDGFSAL